MKFVRQANPKPRISLPTSIGAASLSLALLISALRAGPATAASPGFAELQYRKGLALNRTRQFESAITFLTNAINAKSDKLTGTSELARAYECRGDCYIQLEKFEAARVDVNKAIALDPKLAAAYADRGRLDSEKGDNKQAIVDFSKAIELSNGKAPFMYYKDRSALYQDSGADDKALADLDAVLKQDPRNTWVHHCRANILYKHGKYKEAVDESTISLKFNPVEEKGAFYQLRAKCYEKLGKHDLAKKDRESAQSGIDVDWATRR